MMNRNYKTSNPQVLSSGFLKVYSVHVSYISSKGELMLINREYLDRGQAAAVLVYNKDTDEFLFTRQFRLPVSFAHDPWILELCAGMIDLGERPEDAIRRELREELGYDTDEFTSIAACYVSPGGSTERNYIFYTEISEENKVSSGGGLEEENEDIEIVRMPVSEAIERLQTGEWQDAKSIIALQWWSLHKAHRT